MCIVGATTGAVNQVPNWIDEANITQTTARITVNEKILDSKFLLFSLRSFLTKHQIATSVKGAAQPGLNLEMVENFFIFVPNLYDQKQIAEFLDKQTTHLDNLISKSQSQINLLQEKRQAIITAAVTGKIDVRNGVAA
jgi:type I restriction enzyme S subunit